MRRVSQWSSCFWLLLLALVTSVPGHGQVETPVFRQSFVTLGTVVSASATTLLIESPDARYHLYVFDKYTVKPKYIAAGSPVSVRSFISGDPEVQMADKVEFIPFSALTTAAKASPAVGNTDTSAGQTATKPPSGTAASGNAAAVAAAPAASPYERRQALKLQQEIERQQGVIRVGARSGFTLNPELVMIGAQAQIGPKWGAFAFRAGGEYLFGELTNMWAVNLDAIFKLPFSSRTARWGVYGGIGPAFNFVDRTDGSNEGFHYSTGMNVLAGVQLRNGIFTEIKASPYSSPAPVFHIVMGYNY
jgi:hypothetical protein